VARVLESVVDSADFFWQGLAFACVFTVEYARYTRLQVEYAPVNAILDDEASDISLLLLANTEHAAEGLLLNL
jgi:hypothetical protein